MRQGPLTGLKVVEFAGIWPGPFCGMLLADLGADVVLHRPQGRSRCGAPSDIAARSRRSIALDLKTPGAIETCLKMMETADAVIEASGQVSSERLGLEPGDCLATQSQAGFRPDDGLGLPVNRPIRQRRWPRRHELHRHHRCALHAIGTSEKPIPR